MTPFALSGVLAGITTTLFGLLVLLKSKNRKIGVLWFIFSLSVSAWGWGGAFIGSTDDPQTSFLAWKTSYIFGVNWIPVLFYHFVCVFLGCRRTLLIISQYTVSLLFSVAVFTNFLLKDDMQLLFNSIYYADYGSLYPLYFLWWAGVVFWSHIEMINVYRHSTPEKKNQIRYFFIATAIGYGGGTLCFLPTFHIPIYPWGNFTIFLYPFIMAYAILRYRLMDTTLFLRRTVLLFGIYGGLVVLSIPLLGLFHSSTLSGLGWPVIAEILGVAAILSVGPFLYAYLVRRSGLFGETVRAGLTHELKSPLASIEGINNLFKENLEMASFNKEDLNLYQEIIQTNAQRLRKTIDDLLCTFQLPNKTADINRKRVDVKKMCEAVVSNFAYHRSGKKIQTRWDPTVDSLTIQGDETKIRQILSNLLSNASKFGGEGKVALSFWQKGDDVQFSVKDHGRGIPHQDVPHIFDRFYQGSNTKGFKGTGIGLTVAKNWVEAHGGRIWAESEGEGKGTTVCFTIPL